MFYVPVFYTDTIHLVFATFGVFPGAAGFNVKHAQTGICIIDTSLIQDGKGPTWGNLSLMKISNNCLNPAAQFHFNDDGAMFKFLSPHYQHSSGSC